MLGWVDSLLNIGTKIIDRVIPDPVKNAAAKLELLKLQQDGEFRSDELSIQAITSEAKSDDKWTSRARPSFLYVVYILILSSIPMGILYAFSPVIAGNISIGFKDWLAAIPQPLYTLFGAGYLGYVSGRSYDKKQKSKIELNEKIKRLEEELKMLQALLVEKNKQLRAKK